MKITLILTGKTKADYLLEGFNIYVKRIKHYVPFNVEILPDLKFSNKTEISLVQKREGEQLLQKVKQGDHLILLDDKGKSYTSEKFANHLQQLEGRTGSVLFVIGGAYGFSDEVYARASEKLSLSEMTFSHQMVRLIFAEQLYRAYSILNGEPYHHK